MYFILDCISFELATWDFWSIFALLMLLVGISSKIPLGIIGSSIFVFQILGNYWGTGYVILSLITEICERLSIYHLRKFSIQMALYEFGAEKMKSNIKHIAKECEKIRNTINPDNMYDDSSLNDWRLKDDD